MIDPKAESFILKYPVKGRAKVNFEFEVFIIILVLSYLLSYKIVDYLADFKTLKKRSRLEILFLLLFFSILFIPMLNINTLGKVSKAENRTLATWQPLISKDGNINYMFGKNFDSWYNDRFFMRDILVISYMDLCYNLASNYYETNNVFINKKTNWMGNSKVPSNDLYTIDKMKTAAANVKRLQAFCNKNNIKLYILIAPSKYAIHQKDFYPLLKPSKEYNKVRKMIDYINKETGLNIVYPYNELQELAKKDYAFFKSDHHWTDEGAYIGYLQLMQQIKKDYPNIYIASEKDFDYFYSNKIRVCPDLPLHRGRTYERISLHKDNYKALDTDYKYFQHKNYKKAKLTVESFGKENYHLKHVDYPLNAPKLLLWGDSFGENLMQPIIYSFKDTERIYTYAPDGQESTLYRTMNIDRFEQYIKDNHTDVFVVCLSDIKRLQYLYKKD